MCTVCRPAERGSRGKIPVRIEMKIIIDTRYIIIYNAHKNDFKFNFVKFVKLFTHRR